MKRTTTPTMDQALRAYIIKSRVRDGSNLLLVQPYSPMLLRQGVQPGPHSLLETLRRKLTPKEAKAQWAVFVKQQHEKDKHTFAWMEDILLPCRQCSDSKGEDVLKPLKAPRDPTVRTADETWNMCISKGQDLTCWKCKSDAWRKRFTAGSKRRKDDPNA